MRNHKTNPLTEEPGEIAELAVQAEQGDAKAQYSLGMELSMKNVFVSDPDPVEAAERARKAADWFRKAAEQGHAKAMFCYGLSCFFRSGNVEEPDNSLKAMAWLNLAAELGVQETIQYTSRLALNMTESQIAEAESMRQAYRERYVSEQGNNLARDETIQQNLPTQDQPPPSPGS